MPCVSVNLLEKKNKCMLEHSRVRGYLARTPESIYEVDICYTSAVVQHVGSVPHIFEDSHLSHERWWILAFPASLATREPA